MSVRADVLNQTLTQARARLIDSMNADGHWVGRLSSSALSTATAVNALIRYREASADSCQKSAASAPVSSAQFDTLIENGLAWLSRHQSADGGWGDTTKSFSNISTTALCWASFAGADRRFPQTVKSAEAWLTRAAGSLNAPTLAGAIKDRYGKDRTFSVPILTALALAGRLGPGRGGWELIPQLPFELAALPHQWFAALRLPVVSYALPALIAMGLAHHRQRPTRNILLGPLRNGVTRRTLAVLESIQPPNGGFLEATPLTSFVAMSLIGAGEAGHPVVHRCVDFLVQSVREDGSWPIDTNLATWVSTLSVNALCHSVQDCQSGLPESRRASEASAGPPVSTRGPELVGRRPAGSWNRGGLVPPCDSSDVAELLGTGLRVKLREWLLGQQHRVAHPYTHAAPGGWAWNDLPGAVPDADDTSGALVALKALDDGTNELRQAVISGLKWLLDLQNSDGGIPTFCRGWGALPFDRSSPDLTAHAIRAWNAWHDDVSPALQKRLDRGLERALGYLATSQRSDGSWLPLWFGNQHAVDETNPTYGTTRVVLALAEIGPVPMSQASPSPDIVRAVKWILDCQNVDGGWGGMPGTPSSIEETAFAIEALAAAEYLSSPDSGRRAGVPLAPTTLNAIAKGVDWIADQTAKGQDFPPSPIGFYFAKLWYYEDLYPLVFTVAALGRVAGVTRGLDPATEHAEART